MLGGRNILFYEPMPDAGKIANVGYRAGAPNVAAKFIRIAFAHKNSAVTQNGAFTDLARCPVVVTDFIRCIQSIEAGGEMQGRDLLFAREFQITPTWRSFARTNEPRIRTASARRE